MLFRPNQKRFRSHVGQLRLRQLCPRPRQLHLRLRQLHLRLRQLHLRLRQLGTWVTLAALVACAVGMPLPQRVEKDTSVAYPCMNCPCGCKNAEVCWRNCCCYSQQEKLAWARRQGITPPAYAQAAVETLVKVHRPSCCRDQEPCCQSQSRPNGCGSAEVCDLSRQQRRRRPPALSTVLFVQALRCHGLTSTLTALPPSIVPPQVVDAHSAPPAGTVNHLDDPLFLGAHAVPDTPPPERGA